MPKQQKIQAIGESLSEEPKFAPDQETAMLFLNIVTLVTT